MESKTRFFFLVAHRYTQTASFRGSKLPKIRTYVLGGLLKGPVSRVNFPKSGDRELMGICWVVPPPSNSGNEGL